jgi:oligopeptide/dipeptide ABC transporter ATP-binding protein
VTPLLTVENLHTYFYSRSRRAFVRSVDGVDLEVMRGETLGVVGESGSGKSVTALSVMGLISGEPGVIQGKIYLENQEGGRSNLLQGLEAFVQATARSGGIVSVTKDRLGWRRQVERNLQGVRGRKIAMIFQNPKLALNPFVTIGKQISESIRLNTAVRKRAEARELAIHWLERVKIDAPRVRYHNNPYGLSGGMCQRAMIAMALAAEPSLLIADEPTTGLDATIQSKIVELLGEIKASVGVTTLLISHDVDVIRTLSDKVAVMYGGTVLEQGSVSELLDSNKESKHPYTAALLASVPDRRQIQAKCRLKAIRGEVPDTIAPPAGCRFFPRCDRVTAAVSRRCREQVPALREVGPGHRIRCWLFAGSGRESAPPVAVSEKA